MTRGYNDGHNNENDDDELSGLPTREMSQREQTKLEGMGCGPETVELAMALVRKAKPRTSAGSGHELGQLSTSLVPICALLASERCVSLFYDFILVL